MHFDEGRITYVNVLWKDNLDTEPAFFKVASMKDVSVLILCILGNLVYILNRLQLSTDR